MLLVKDLKFIKYKIEYYSISVLKDNLLLGFSMSHQTFLHPFFSVTILYIVNIINIHIVHIVYDMLYMYIY